MSDQTIAASSFYVTGGTIKPGTPSYVVRDADDELYRAIIAGEFCYVLTTRQMGKSSLMARTAARLAQEAIRSAQIDLTLIGADKESVIADEWYYGVAYRILRELKVNEPLEGWWRTRSLMPPVQRFTEFLSDLVLSNCPEKVVVFVDEIDSTIGLPFSDDFFAAIRGCLNARATDGRFRRLNFVLLGVATPAQSIRDSTRTPFNVGRGIELTDFTMSEAAGLAAGLSIDPKRANQRLQQILEWTGGHPNLTQTLCWHVATNETWGVDEIVQQVFLSRQSTREQANLSFVRERLTQGGSNLAEVLGVYQRIIKKQSVRDEPISPIHASLKLSGVVKRDRNGELRVRNKLYERAFSEQWVRLEMPEQPDAHAVEGEVGDAYLTHDALRKVPVLRSQAVETLAQFWETRGARDEALITRLSGLLGDDTEEKRRRAASLVQFDYPSLLVAYVHRASVLAATFSSNGRRIVTGSADRTARVWSVATGEPIGLPLRHTASVRAVALNYRGDLVASGSDDHTACVWDAETGILQGSPIDHSGRILSIAFSPQGDRLLTTSADGSVTIWPLNSDEPLLRLSTEATNPIAAFSPDGRRLVASVTDESVCLWHILWQKRFGRVIEHQGTVTALAFRPDSKAFATASNDGTARIWSTEWGLPLSTPLMHGDAVLTVTFSPDGEMVATGSTDHSARLWHTSSGILARHPLWHEADVSSISFDQNLTKVITGSADGVVRIWSADDGQPLTPAYRHQGRIRSISISPDGCKVLVCAEENKARLWQSNEQVVTKDSNNWAASHSEEILAANFSTDGTRIVTCSADNTAKIWEVSEQMHPPISLLHPQRVFFSAFSNDGELIATGCEDGTVCIWSTDSGQPLGPIIRHQAAVRVVAFHPDSSIIAIGSDDKSASVWSLNAGEMTGPLLLHGGSVRTLAFSPEGRTLLTGSYDRTVRLWDVSSGDPLGYPLWHSSAVSAVAWAPNGDRVLTATLDGTVTLWFSKTGIQADDRWLKVFSYEFRMPIAGVTFSRDGQCFSVMTADWIYFYRLEKETPLLVSARLLPGGWVGAFHWCEKTECADLGVLDAATSLFIVRLKIGTPEIPPLQGDPHELLTDWQHRLGIQIDKRNRLSPMFLTE